MVWRWRRGVWRWRPADAQMWRSTRPMIHISMRSGLALVAAEDLKVEAKAEGLEVAAGGLEVEAACRRPDVALNHTNDTH